MDNKMQFMGEVLAILKKTVSGSSRRILALLLCLSMALTGVIGTTLAAELNSQESESEATIGDTVTGLCKHHPEHDAQCGYVEAVEGAACTHVHDSECGYVEAVESAPCTHEHDVSCHIIDCVHAHTEDCYADGELPDEGEEKEADACAHTHDEACYALDCTHVHDMACYDLVCTHEHDEACYVENYAHEHGETCDAENCAHEHSEEYYDLTCAHVHGEECYVENCAHEHDDENCYLLDCPHERDEHDDTCGYAETVEGQSCTHEHDNICGYVEAVEGHPCEYVCDVCGKDDEGDPFTVTDWSWVDPNEELFSVAEYDLNVADVDWATVLAVSSAEELLARLPQEVNVTLQNGEETVLPITWDGGTFVTDMLLIGENQTDETTPEATEETAAAEESGIALSAARTPGYYVYVASLPEGYTLDADAAALKVLTRFMEIRLPLTSGNSPARLPALWAMPYALTVTDVSAHHTDDVLDRVADGDTLGDYLNTMNLYASSRYAGRVWSDKSVFAHDKSAETNTLSLTIDRDGIEDSVEYNSDFLHVFSALGSSLETKGQNQLPLDVVFIVDTSGSMSSEDNSLWGDAASRGGHQNNDRSHQMGLALNEAAKLLMDANPNNRFAVVRFDTDAEEVLPLDHYKPTGAGGAYFTPVQTYDYEGTLFQRKERLGGLTPVINEVVTVPSEVSYSYRKINITVEGETVGKPRATYMQIEDPLNQRYRRGMTNTQLGLYTGMKVLADRTDTTVMVDEQKLQRIPVVILLTDGQPTRYLTDTSWWEPNTSGINGEAAAWDAYSGEGLMALATGAYMKKLINRAYFGGVNGDTAKGDAYAAKVYTFGLELNYIQGNALDLANIVMNPGANLNNTNTMANEIRGLWETYYRGGQPSFTVGNLATGTFFGAEYFIAGSETTHSLHHPTKNFDGTVIDIDDSPDAAVALNYVNGYTPVADAGDLVNAFTRIITEIVENAPWIPVAGTNDAGMKDVLTYIDPIGKYMEVKDVRGVLLFGQMYGVLKQEDPVKEADGVTRQYYTLDPTGLETVKNPCYAGKLENGADTFLLSDIKIWVETTDDNQDATVGGNNGLVTDTGYDQALYVKIPANALPLWVVSVDTTNGQIQYTTNRDNANDIASPLRVFYEVGMREDVLVDPGSGNREIDLGKIDADYLRTHKDEKTGAVWFYSNWYAGNTYGDYVNPNHNNSYTYGDPVLTFSPSGENRYYIYQKYLPVYECNWSGSGTQPPDITDQNQIDGLTRVSSAVNSEKWYYVRIDYYEKTAGGGKEVRIAVPRYGAMFGSGIGGSDVKKGEYLVWYNPSTGDVKPYSADRPDEGYYIYTDVGGVRTGNMSQNVQEKTPQSNVTHTAGTYYLPTISTSSGAGADGTRFNNYMGNNGRLTVANTQLLVTKTVRSDENPLLTDEEPFTFTVKLTKDNQPARDGTYSAIKVAWETWEIGGEKYSTWRALLNSIQLLTDGDSESGYFLRQTDDNKGGGKATITINNVDYYIQVDKENPELFSSEKGSLTDAFPVGADGKANITINATLVPVSGLGASIPNYTVTVGQIYMYAEIAHEVTLNYSGSISYQTEAVTFVNGEATFTLTHGQGLLFNGLDTGTWYEVTEILKKEQMELKEHTASKEGSQDVSAVFQWEFDYVEYQANDGASERMKPAGVKDPPDGEPPTDMHYTVSGTTGSIKDGETVVTSKVHYYNMTSTVQPGLELEKEVVGSVDPQTEFKFRIKLEQPDLDEGTGDPTGKYETVPKGTIFHAYIHEAGHQIPIESEGSDAPDNPDQEPKTRDCGPADHPHGSDGHIDLYVVDGGMVYVIETWNADKSGPAADGLKMLALKPSQVCVILDLPEGTRYTITEVFDKAEGSEEDEGKNYFTEIEVDDKKPDKAESGDPWPPADRDWSSEGPVMWERTVTGTLPTLDPDNMGDEFTAVRVKYINHRLVDMPGTGVEAVAPWPIELIGAALLLMAAGVSYCCRKRRIRRP